MKLVMKKDTVLFAKIKTISKQLYVFIKFFQTE